MYKTNNKDIWRVFREHHYLSNDLNKASNCYTLYWDDILIGFSGILTQPSGTLKYARRISRLVILPDYQNLGAGTKFNEFICELYLKKGLKINIRTTHLRLNNYFESHKQWIATSSNKKISNDIGKNANIIYGIKDREINRIAYSFEYKGIDYIDKPHINIHIENTDLINYNLLKIDLQYLKEKYYIVVITGEINTPNKIEDICLELGIRTQLLYHTRNGVSKISNKYKNKKIITNYNDSFSQKVRNYYTNHYSELYKEHIRGE